MSNEMSLSWLRNNVIYSVECDEIHGGSSNKQTFRIIKDKSHKISSIQNLNQENKSSKLKERIKLFFYEAFLPQGFPDSVSNDYIEYQVWDTSQAFCSTLTSVLTTHAIMQGVGVGNESATALAAATAWIIKDGTGMLGRILFAWWKGSILDSDCKRWRIIADILNDAAMCLELMLPVFPQNFIVYILAISSLGKSLVGVAGGATRAAITLHQAKSGNIGDVAAKDGSQETCINLIASLLGLLILKITSENNLLTWILFLVLTVCHIYSNYKAVKSLQFNTLNRQRFLIIFKHYLQTKTILTPEYVRKEERILFPYTEKEMFNFNIQLGKSISSLNENDFCFTKHKDHFTICKMSPHESINILLNNNVDVKNILKSYCMAVFLQYKKVVNQSISLFQLEIKYENDEEEFKEKFFEEFYYKLSKTSEWDLTHLNHFQIDEWRYQDLIIQTVKEKTN